MYIDTLEKQGKTVDYENKPKQTQRERHEIRHTDKETNKHTGKRQTKR